MKLSKLLKPLLPKIVPSLAAIFSNFVGRTSPLTIIAPEGLQTRRQILTWEKGVIYCCWHSRFFYYSYFGRGHRVVTMISASRDGEIIVRTIEKMRLYAVRGSSSRHGRQALEQMRQLVEKNFKVLMIPDGPRGPRHVLKPGAIRLAQLTGRPILPISFSTTRGLFLPSWDRFLAPLPFGKAVVSIGEPIYVARKLRKDEFERIRLYVQQKLIEVTQLADKACGRDPEKEVIKKRKEKL